jgi:fusion and transport protein UGO1
VADPRIAPPQEEWLFLPPTGNNRQQTNASSFSTSPTTSGIGGGLPGATLAGVEIDPSDPEESLTFSDIAQLFASEFLTTAMGMPFEVGKTLLQVEYKPKAGVVVGTIDEEVVEERVGEMTDEESVVDDGERARNVEASVCHTSLFVSSGAHAPLILDYQSGRSRGVFPRRDSRRYAVLHLARNNRR